MITSVRSSTPSSPVAETTTTSSALPAAKGVASLQIQAESGGYVVDAEMKDGSWLVAFFDVSGSKPYAAFVHGDTSTVDQALADPSLMRPFTRADVKPMAEILDAAKAFAETDQALLKTVSNVLGGPSASPARAPKPRTVMEYLARNRNDLGLARAATIFDTLFGR